MVDILVGKALVVGLHNRLVNMLEHTMMNKGKHKLLVWLELVVLVEVEYLVLVRKQHALCIWLGVVQVFVERQ